MTTLTSDAAWSFRAHLETPDDVRTYDRAALEAGVRRELAALGDVSALATESIHNWLSQDTFAIAATLAPRAAVDTDRKLAQSILDGANSARGARAPFHPTGTFLNVAGAMVTHPVGFVTRSADYQAAAFNLDSVVTDVVRGPVPPVTTASRYTAGRVLAAASVNDQGTTLAAETVAQTASTNPWLTIAIVGGLAVVGLLAVGYGLRPIAALVREVKT